jgi:hypothetical protein
VVKTIAVIGADIVGCRIASIAALSGYDTVLEDVSNERLAKAATWIERESFAAGGAPDARERDAAAGRVSLAHTVEDAIRDADYYPRQIRKTKCYFREYGLSVDNGTGGDHLLRRSLHRHAIC